MIEEYLNFDHGLELSKGNTQGRRGNENGILFYCEYLILKEMSGQELDNSDLLTFTKIMEGLTVEKGLYDRGKSDKDVENPKRTLSHDNISAIASASKMLNTNHAKDIAKYGLKHLFVYNNNQTGFRLPMNPANYTMWLALANISVFLQIIFLPFFLINFIITMSKPKENTSSKLLYLVELYPLRYTMYGVIFKLYLFLLERQYGEDYFREIFAIYFKDYDHPINKLARDL